MEKQVSHRRKTQDTHFVWLSDYRSEFPAYNILDRFDRQSEYQYVAANIDLKYQ